MTNYKIQYRARGLKTVQNITVKASSASDAREQVKARYKGDVEIVSCVEKK